MKHHFRFAPRARAVDPAKTIILGFLTPMSGGIWDGGRTNSGALTLAVKHVNSEGLLGDYSLNYLWRDSQCDAGKALAAMSELLDAGADVFIGPGCSTACEPTQLLVSNRDLVQVMLLFFFDSLDHEVLVNEHDW